MAEKQIISVLLQVLEVHNKYNIMFNAAQKNMDAVKSELKWRKWADNVLVHVLSPNVYRTREEALQAFNYFSEVRHSKYLSSGYPVIVNRLDGRTT